MSLNSPQISVVIPAFNEEARLHISLEKIWQAVRRRFPSFEIIVVSDGSTDRTNQIVEDFIQGHDGVRLISYEKNRGKGYAVRRGVYESKGDLVLFTDADLSTPFREIRKLQTALEEADIAIGSRALRDSKIVEYQPFYRVLMGKTFNKIVQLMTIRGIKDTQCGFKLFRGTQAREIFCCCRIDGFGFDVEVLYVARRRGLKISEVGVLWRNDPMSKVHPIKHSMQMFSEILKIRINDWRGCYSGRADTRCNIVA